MKRKEKQHKGQIWRVRHGFLGGKRKKLKTKAFSDAPEVFRPHELHGEEKKIEMNPMMQWNNGFDHRYQLHPSSEDTKVTYMLTVFFKKYYYIALETQKSLKKIILKWRINSSNQPLESLNSRARKSLYYSKNVKYQKGF